MPKLDVYAIDDLFVDVVAPDVFRIKDGVFRIKIGDFQIQYPLAESHYRVVMGVLRDSEDPTRVQGVSIVYMVYVWKSNRAVHLHRVVPLRIGVSYLPDSTGVAHTSVVVDGFPVFVSPSYVLNIEKVKDYISKYKLLSSA